MKPLFILSIGTSSFLVFLFLLECITISNDDRQVITAGTDDDIATTTSSSRVMQSNNGVSTSPTTDDAPQLPSPRSTTQPSVESTSPAPSLALSAEPSLTPPSTSPSSPPTISPTASPSSSPSNVPPTGKPTLEPTRSRSNSPTGSPTISPSSSPSETPPNAQPTEYPSREPTRSPAISPSGQPSTAPTYFPTGTPTISPTGAPSPQPSTSPTREPTMSPTNYPTEEPTSSPSNAPTDYPSFSPSIAPLQQLTATENTMTLQNISPLDSIRILEWQRVTREHLRDELPLVWGAELADISVSLVSQNPPYTGDRRQLQSGSLPVQEITFDTIISIKSARDDFDVNSFVDQAFETEEQKNAYLQELRASHEGFANAANLQMTQGPSNVSPASAPGATDGGSRVDTSGIPFIVVVSVCGTVLVALFVALIVYTQRRRKAPPQRPPISSESNPSLTPGRNYTFPIDEGDSLYDLNMEVPTRVSGDSESIFTNNSSVTMDFGDQSVAFQKESLYASADINVGDAPGGGVTDSYGRRRSVQCYRYTIEAPPGMLGLVLEPSVDGTPCVYGIKSSSPLAGEVRIGDRLMNVDGLDVTEMEDTMAVSHLIASKRKNKFRQLTFVRPLDNDDALDLDVEEEHPA